MMQSLVYENVTLVQLIHFKEGFVVLTHIASLAFLCSSVQDVDFMYMLVWCLLDIVYLKAAELSPL